MRSCFINAVIVLEIRFDDSMNISTPAHSGIVVVYKSSVTLIRLKLDACGGIKQ